jgi:hypothetical protein
MLSKSDLTIACLFGLTLGLSAGCSSEPKDPFENWNAAVRYNEFVPPSAQTVKSGSGVLEFTAPEDGMLYLLDTSKTVQVEGVTKPTVVITGYVAADKHVIFDPSEKRIRMKGREGVKLTQVDPSHVHEFRFDPNAMKPGNMSK